MAADRTLETCAPVHFLELADSEGRLVLLPLSTVCQLQAKGLSSITLTISLEPEVDLAAVVRAWPDLPPAIRAGILAMVCAAVGPESEAGK